MKNIVKLNKAVKDLPFAAVSSSGYVTFKDVDALYYNAPFNAKDMIQIKKVSKKSISEIRAEIVNRYAEQLRKIIFYKEIINLIWLKEAQGWDIRGNWTMNGKMECYKDGVHKSVCVYDLKNL